jgi:hypothetical protein
MTAASLTAVRPTNLTFLGISRSLIPGSADLPGTYPGITGMASTVPLDKSTYEPEDTPRWLMDTAVRGSMAHTYSVIQGPEDATFNYGGPFYGDIEGYFFDNAFGDLSTTGSSPANTTTLVGTAAVYSTTGTLASITGYTAGSFVQIGTGSTAEVVVLSGTAAGSIINFTNTPLRFPHVASTVTTVTGPYTHRFAILQQGPWNGTGQPPVHAVTDYTGLTAVTGARTYPYLCVSQLDLTGNTEQLFEVKATGNSWLSTPASGTTVPANLPSAIVPIPAWQSTISVGGTALTQVGEWAFSVKRELQVYWTAQGTQSPFVIGRGSLDATLTLNYTVATDETALLLMLNNTQPSVSVTVNNGLSGTANVTCTMTSSVAAYTKAKPSRSAVLMGYEDELQCVANSTDTGGSAGLGPMTITLTNNVPTY